MNKRSSFLALLCAFFLSFLFVGCSTLETADAQVTLHKPYVLTDSGLSPQDEMTPGTYALNQIVDAGTYRRADLQQIMPGRSLPAGATIQPGESPSLFETVAYSIGTIADSVPGGQPVGALALGIAVFGKMWRDKRKLNDVQLAARTIGQIYDTALDINATDTDRERALEREARMDKARGELVSKVGRVRDLVDAILDETATPTKHYADA